jgi:heme exporter protein D
MSIARPLAVSGTMPGMNWLLFGMTAAALALLVAVSISKKE